MGIRIVVGDREPIGLALRRLKRLLQVNNLPRELLQRAHCVDATETRRAKRFKKRFKAREATLLAQMAGEQTVSSLAEARVLFWKRTGKP
jgi:ribosomal protein S21